MIEVNLLKQDALNVVAQELGEDLSSFVTDSALAAKKNKRLLIVGSITAISWIVIIFFFGPNIVRMIMRSEAPATEIIATQIDVVPLPEIGLKEVERPLPQISINEENVVEEIVLGIRQKIEKKKKKVIPKLLDFEKIHNQKLMVYTALKRIGDAASLKVTFGKMVIKIPNYYYLHGLASDNANYTKFKSTLTTASSQIKESPIKQVGLVGKTKEFTLYGALKTAEIKETKVNLISKNSIRNYNRDLIDLAENLNVKVMDLKPKTPRVLHGYESHSFKLNVSGRYKDLAEFVKKLHDRQFPVGILQLSVIPTEDQKMLSSFDIVYYTKR